MDIYFLVLNGELQCNMYTAKITNVEPNEQKDKISQCKNQIWISTNQIHKDKCSSFRNKYIGKMILQRNRLLLDFLWIRKP